MQNVTIRTDERSGIVFINNEDDDELYVTLDSLAAFTKTESYDIVNYLYNANMEQMKIYNGTSLLNMMQFFKVLKNFHEKSLFYFFFGGVSALYDYLGMLKR